MDLTIRQWECITRTPVLVFAVVAMADTVISEEERTAFAQLWLPRLRDFEVSKIDYDRIVFQSALDRAADRWAGIAQLGESAIMEELKGAVRVIDECFSEASAQAWKDALKKLGVDVAEASGGFFCIVDPIDADEDRILKRIGALMEGRS